MDTSYIFFDMHIDLYKNPKFCYVSDVYDTNKNEIVNLCSKCGTPYVSNAHDLSIEIERGNQYPDFLYCPFGLLIVSEKVLSDWQIAKISGYSYYNVKIVKKLTSGLRTITEKKYFHIAINGFCDFDKNKSDIMIMSKCTFCGNIKYRQIWENGTANFIFDNKTWNKADVFKTSITNDFFCTKSLVVCALNNGHTGVSFYPSDDAFIEDKRYIRNMKELDKYN